MSRDIHTKDFKKQRLQSQKISAKADQALQAQAGKHEVEFSTYKKLEKKFSEIEPTTRQKIIGFLLLSMTLGAEGARLGNIMGINAGVGRVKQPKASASAAENPPARFDYKALEKLLSDAAREYKISMAELEAANNFLEEYPEIDPAKLASDTADFESRSDGWASDSDISNFVADKIKSYAGAILVAGATTAAVVSGALSSAKRQISNPLSYASSLEKITSLAIAAATAFLPAVASEKTDKIKSDIKRIEEGAKTAGLFQSVKSVYSNFLGLLPDIYEVPQNYKENDSFMTLLSEMIAYGSLQETGDRTREYLASEAYLQTKAFIEAIADVYNLDSASKTDKQIIGRAILCDKTTGYDHNAFHLLGVPVVQIAGEVDNYKLMLEGIRDFLLKTKLPIKEAFAKDPAGNNPLHIMAAVTPLNQFQAFCDSFGDLIPEKFWNQKNHKGHSPLDILNKAEVQKEAIGYISETMKGSFVIHTSVEAPSDMLHKPGSLERKFYPGAKDSVTLKNGMKMFSFPKSAYVKLPNGEYGMMDLLNKKPLYRIPAEDYKEIEPILPGGTSYAVLAFESRAEKLQIAKEVMAKKQENKPEPEVENADASKLAKKGKTVEVDP